jgi:hypothetical protein
MATESQTDDLMERLHANGLRKRVARDLSTAIAVAGSSGPSKAAQTKIAELRKVVADLEDRAKGGPAKRSAIAKKAAATRKRKAAQRSAAARKAARTRAKAEA